MSEVVNVEVASAIVVSGQIVLPGQVVEVPASDARMLVAQGKAKWVEGAEKSEVDAQEDAPRASAKGRKVRAS